ncbi:hypothetical protein D3C80_2138610 [compost metagenome]
MLQRSSQRLGHFPKAFVALQMPVGIIVFLEEVHIDEQNRHWRALYQTSPELHLELIVKISPVIHAGQTVDY